MKIKRGLILCILFSLPLIFLAGVTSAETTPPNITFILQNPADVSTLNLYSSGFNVTYNITDTTGVNPSSVFMSRKTNSSSSNIQIYVNGTPQTGFFSETGTNISINWTFKLDDNDVYPGAWVLNPETFENTAHSIFSIGALDAIKTEFFNISNSTAYNDFEFMVNSTVTPSPTSLFAFYCNSTYTTGSVTTNNNCFQFGSISANATYQVTNPSLNNSRYQLLAFTINTTTGKIGTVVVTPRSYFILRKGNGATSWNAYKISSTSRSTTTQTSTNNGAAWTNQTYSFDEHVHQYDIANTFYYYVCANDTFNPINSGCSETRTDLLGLGGLPPSAPHVVNPFSQVYAGNISINYTQAVSPNGYAITFYNISLTNIDETFNKSIQSNNSLNLSYIWNSIGTADETYLVKVVATDNQSQTSFDFSENFTIDNTYPALSVSSPLHQNYTTSQILVNFSSQDTHLASNWYGNRTTNITYSSPVTLTLTDGNYNFIFYANDSAGNLNSTSVAFGVDSNAPSITIISPASIIYNYNQSLSLNVTATDLNLASCWWNIDSGVNTSITCNANVTFNTTEEAHTIRYYANDTYGNLNSASVYFDIDITLPSIVLISPIDEAKHNFSLTEFNFSVTDHHSVSSCQLWGNFTGTWQKNQTLLSPAKDTNLAFSRIGLNDGNYVWNVWCNDSNNDNSFSLNNHTLLIDTQNPSISFGTGTENRSISNTGSIFVNVSATDTNLANITFYLFDSDGQMNSTTTSEKVINFSSLPDEVYYFNVTATDLAGNSNHTQTRNITLDSTPPAIEIITVDDNYYAFSESVDLNFSFNVTDDNINECAIIINGSENSFSPIGTISNPNSIVKTLLRGDYSWKVNCSDLAGNGAESVPRTITINWSVVSNQESPQINLTTDGGMYAPKTYYVDEQFPNNGDSYSLYYSDKIKFMINLTDHTLTLGNFNSTTAKVLIESSPMVAYLEKGILTEFDINDDSIKDVKVRYDGLNRTRAMIFVQGIVHSPNNDNENIENQQDVDNSPELKSNKSVYFILAGVTALIVILIVIAILTFVLHKKHKKKRYYNLGY